MSYDSIILTQKNQQNMANNVPHTRKTTTKIRAKLSFILLLFILFRMLYTLIHGIKWTKAKTL